MVPAEHLFIFGANGDAVGYRQEHSMVAKIVIAHNVSRLAIAAMATLLLLSGTAVAQLGFSGTWPLPGTGIPFGATGLTSPGLSPAPDGTIRVTGTGTTCSAVGSSSSGVSG